MGKFDELIYTLPRSCGKCSAAVAASCVCFPGNEALRGADMRIEFSVIQHETLAEIPHIHHAAEEYYMFSGADLTAFFDFDAEIELFLGENPNEMEKYTITKPTIVRIPSRMWHGPINYNRVGKPVSFTSVYFDGESSKITRRVNADGTVEFPYVGSGVPEKTGACAVCSGCSGCDPRCPDISFAYEWAKKIASSKPAPRSGKFDKLFFEYPVEYHNYGDTYANPRGKFRGIMQMPECNFYGGFSVVLKPTFMEEPHMHHARSEYLWFGGSDMSNIFDFDGEVELFLGESPDKMEKIIITQPTVVRVPPNMWHTPINFKRVDKPIAFLPLYGDGDWSKVVRREKADGEYEYLFEAASLRKCVYNHNAICVYCGKCLKDDSVPSFGVFL